MCECGKAFGAFESIAVKLGSCTSRCHGRMSLDIGAIAVNLVPVRGDSCSLYLAIVVCRLEEPLAEQRWKWRLKVEFENRESWWERVKLSHIGIAVASWHLTWKFQRSVVIAELLICPPVEFLYSLSTGLISSNSMSRLESLVRVSSGWSVFGKIEWNILSALNESIL